MNNIFINLKRFEVSRQLGGLCPVASPFVWLEDILAECVKAGLGCLPDIHTVFLLPEALIGAAAAKLSRENIEVGCQGVHREDITPGGNFGAFTASRPAAAMKAIGATWAIVGHSEERKEKIGVINEFLADAPEPLRKLSPNDAVSRLIGQEASAALTGGLDVLFCIGETQEERGGGSFAGQQPRVKATLKKQLELGLAGAPPAGRRLVVGYEPVWAIGPGKTPPGQDYIAFVSYYIKETAKELWGFCPQVVYGGGLKEENARIIASIDSIDGGLVALTRFSGDVGFYPDDLKKIINEYRGQGA